ncbi:MAG: exo-alpha-sialidase [Haliscomenobacter sp.]|nr:exo-alpha-sialidase [Haliscomenobacter sp.]
MIPIHFLFVLLFSPIFFTGGPAPAVISIPTASLKAAFPEVFPKPEEEILQQSADGGQSWVEVSAGLPGKLQPFDFYAEGNEWWLAAAEGLYRGRMVSGQPVWEKDLLIGSPITDIYSGKSGLLVLDGRNGLVHRQSATGLWRSLSQGLNGQGIHSVAETQGGALFVGCDKGIYRSADYGKTWEQVFTSVSGAITKLVEINGVLIAGGNRGVMRSTDNGAHWDWVLTNGGPQWDWSLKGGHAVHIGMLGDNMAAILGAETQFGRQPRNRVFISSDQGATWEALNGGKLPTALNSMYDIEQAGEYLFSTSDAGVFRSADQGKTWELIQPLDAGSATFIRLTASGNRIFALRIMGC